MNSLDAIFASPYGAGLIFCARIIDVSCDTMRVLFAIRLGREGRVEIVNSVVQRAHLDEVMGIVDQWDPDAFVTVEESKVLRGGSLVERDWRMPVPFPTRWSTRSHQRA